MKKQTGVDELQFWTAAAIGAREIERRAVAELVRLTGAKLEKKRSGRTVTGRAASKTTQAKRKGKREWTPEQRAEQGKRARRMWKRRRAAAKTRTMSAGG